MKKGIMCRKIRMKCSVCGEIAQIRGMRIIPIFKNDKEEKEYFSLKKEQEKKEKENKINIENLFKTKSIYQCSNCGYCNTNLEKKFKNVDIIYSEEYKKESNKYVKYSMLLMENKFYISAMKYLFSGYYYALSNENFNKEYNKSKVLDLILEYYKFLEKNIKLTRLILIKLIMIDILRIDKRFKLALKFCNDNYPKKYQKIVNLEKQLIKFKINDDIEEVSENFLKGIEKWKKANYKEAEKLLKIASEKDGYVEAQVALGVFYYTKRNLTRSLIYFTMAAKNGNKDAKYEQVYLHKNKKEILEWLSVFIELVENPQLAYEIGLKYYKGIGTNQDYKEAFEWVEFSAEQGYPLAQNRLGIMYYLGQGVKKDYKKAFKYFKLAAKQEDEEKYKYKRIIFTFFDKYNFPKNIPRPVEIDRSGSGIANARYNLGVIYYKGIGVKQNFKKGYKWFIKSAKCDEFDTFSIFTLGLINFVGIGVEKNYKKALKWFKKPIINNVVFSYILGNMYYNGLGIKKNYKKAAEYFENSFPLLGLNNSDLFLLGTIYYFGLDSEKQNNKYIYAYQMYKKATEKGNSHAKFMLGLIYSNGKNRIISKNNKKAIEYFTSAYKNGDDEDKLLFMDILDK